MNALADFNLAAGYATKCRLTDVEFLADCRKILRGSGFHLWLRSRGARAKHAANAWDKRRFFQDLPKRHAEYFAVYVKASRGAEKLWVAKDWQSAYQRRAQAESRAVGMVLAVAKIYAIHGKPVKPGRVSAVEVRAMVKKGGAL